MRLNYKQRQERIAEVNRQAWENVDRSPEVIRENYDKYSRIPIEIIACPLGKAVNHGGLLRIAEAFMLERVTFSYEEDQYNDFSGHQGSIRWQPYRWMNVEEAVEKAKGRQILALTLDDRAVSFRNIDLRYPVSLIVGSELDGIPSEIVAKAEQSVAIPMYGLMGSLNVATATGIVIEHFAHEYARTHQFEPLREVSQKLLKQ